MSDGRSGTTEKGEDFSTAIFFPSTFEDSVSDCAEHRTKFRQHLTGMVMGLRGVVQFEGITFCTLETACARD